MYRKSAQLRVKNKPGNIRPTHKNPVPDFKLLILLTKKYQLFVVLRVEPYIPLLHSLVRHNFQLCHVAECNRVVFKMHLVQAIPRANNIAFGAVWYFAA